MARYILKRLILIIPILIAVSIAVFLLLSLSPNDPALLILGANASEADLEMFREQHGLEPAAGDAVPELYVRPASGRYGYLV